MWKADKIQPFEKLTKKELDDEIIARNLDRNDNISSKPTKAELNKILKAELAGISRFPSLVSANKDKVLDDMLCNYEVAPGESLHDFMNLIKNLMPELEILLEDEGKQIYKHVETRTLGTKTQKRGCDYRHFLVVLTSKLYGHCSNDIFDLVNSLCELCQIAYDHPDNRNNVIILRFSNLTYKHITLCLKLIPSPMFHTLEKFYGTYLHALIHYALTLRLISLSSLNTEDEEREFNTHGNIASRTSSRESNHVITNSIIRMQAEQLSRRKTKKSIQSKISKAAKDLPKPTPTVFSKREIKSSSFQSYCERIADFLELGEGIWWESNGDTVTMFDCPQSTKEVPRLPTMMSYCDYSHKDVERHLKDSWKRCLAKNVRLPLGRLIIYNENGDPVSTKKFSPWYDVNEDVVKENPIARSSDTLTDEMTTGLPIGTEDNIVSMRKINIWKESDSISEDNVSAAMSSEDSFSGISPLDEDQQVEADTGFASTEPKATAAVNPFLDKDKQDKVDFDIVSTTDGKAAIKEATAVAPLLNKEQQDNVGIDVASHIERKVLTRTATAVKPCTASSILKRENELVAQTYNHPITRCIDMVLKGTMSLTLFESYYSLHIANPAEKVARDNYLDQLVPIQQAVIKASNSLENMLDLFDRNFFIENGREPNIKDYKQENQYSNFKRAKYARRLLHDWNINI